MDRQYYAHLAFTTTVAVGSFAVALATGVTNLYVLAGSGVIATGLILTRR